MKIRNLISLALVALVQLTTTAQVTKGNTNKPRPIQEFNIRGNINDIAKNPCDFFCDETPSNIPDFNFSHSVGAMLESHRYLRRAFEKIQNKWYDRQLKLIELEVEKEFGIPFRDIGQARRHMFKHYESRNVYPNVKIPLRSYEGIVSQNLKEQDNYLKNIKLLDIRAHQIELGMIGGPIVNGNLKVRNKFLKDFKTAQQVGGMRAGEEYGFKLNNRILKLNQNVLGKLNEINDLSKTNSLNHNILDELYVIQNNNLGNHERWEQLGLMQVYANNIPRKLPTPPMVLIIGNLLTRDYGTPEFIKDYAVRKSNKNVRLDNLNTLLNTISEEDASVNAHFNTLTERSQKYLDRNPQLKREVEKYFRDKGSTRFIDDILNSAQDNSKFTRHNYNYMADEEAHFQSWTDNNKLIDYKMNHSARTDEFSLFPDITFELFANDKHIISEGGIFREMMEANGMNIPKYLTNEWLGKSFEFEKSHLKHYIRVIYSNENGKFLWYNGVRDFNAHVKFVDDLSNKLNITDNESKGYLFANPKSALALEDNADFYNYSNAVNSFTKNIIRILNDESLNGETKDKKILDALNIFEPEINSTQIIDYEKELLRMATFLKRRTETKEFGIFVEKIAQGLNSYTIGEVKDLYKVVRQIKFDMQKKSAQTIVFAVVESFKPVVDVALIGVGGAMAFKILKALPPIYVSTYIANIITRLGIPASSAYTAFLHAQKYGIQTFDELKREFINLALTRRGLGVQFHHLIEKRFSWNTDVLNWLGSSHNNWKSIVLTPQEHQVFTNAWRQLIPYSNSNQVLNTDTATLEQIKNAAREIYKNYPEILKVLEL